eukprot:768050-Hanusia_phi.AAC.1
MPPGAGAAASDSRVRTDWTGYGTVRRGARRKAPPRLRLPTRRRRAESEGPAPPGSDRTLTLSLGLRPGGCCRPRLTLP